MRGSRALVILPKVAFEIVFPGGKNCGVLNRSKNSDRNSTRKRSPIGNGFTSAKSKLTSPGELMIFRPELPKVPTWLAVNAAVLNHWLTWSLRERLPGKV